MNRGTFSTLCPPAHYTIAAILIVGLGLVGVVHAENHENDEPRIKYRQSVMSAIGMNMGAIGDILKNRLVLPGHVAVHAGQIADSAQLIAPAFKKKITTGATDAKPKIWDDWSGFETAIADLEKAARNLQTAAVSGDPARVGPAVKALGKRCGGCHKPFRKPKEESFKKHLRNHDR